MIPVEQHSIDVKNQFSSFLSYIILMCKTIVLIGLLITFFSDHWAVGHMSSGAYAGYKNRCTVHVCLSSSNDPVWLIDLALYLSAINFIMEFINIIIYHYYNNKTLKIQIALEGFDFLSTFILVICVVVFSVDTLIYADKLPMGYAYNCFMISVCFSIMDWACSLKRLIINWPDPIDLSESALLLHHYLGARRVQSNHVVSEECRMSSSSSNSIPIDETAV